jgi:hypothetical protein
VTNVVSLPAPSLTREPFNAAQRDVLEVLGAPRRAWPTFRRELRDELRAQLDGDLAPIIDRLDELDEVGGSPTRPVVWLNKHTLAAVLGCEARFLDEQSTGFPGWSVPLARGGVVHKAIELSMHVRAPAGAEPLELVDEAIARLAEADSSLGDWLRSLEEVDRADVRATANDQVAKFLECWPPLQAAWRPVTESTWRAEVADDRVVLVGRADLTLQRPEGNVARKIVVDLKTGGFAPSHLDDLRFYALIDTLRLGTPPRLVVTHYLDSGRIVPEPVTEDMLRAAAARVVGAAARLVELRWGGAEPTYRPGPACRWCPLVTGCEAARAAGTAGDDP